MLLTVTSRLSVILIAIIVLVTACTSLQAEPSPTVGASLNQTGFAELDKIITMALGGNVTELQQLLGFTSTNCTFAEGLGGPPKCLKTEKEGNPVEVLPFLGPEGHFLRKEDIESWQGLEVSELYAVYQVSEFAYSEKNYPTGQYAMVFIGNKEEVTSLTLQVKHGKIIRIDYGFVYPPEIRPDNVVRYLVPPTNTNR